MGRDSIHDGEVQERVARVFEHQPDAPLDEANPLNDTWYTVLDTTKRVRLIGISCRTGKTTAGTVSAMQIKVTVDGQSLLGSASDPTENTVYFIRNPSSPDLLLGTTDKTSSFLLEGRNVKVEIKVTWTVQPDPLEAWVSMG